MRHNKSVTVTAAACLLAGGAHAAMTISNAKTKNVTCTSGVCTPTRGNANLNVGELQTMLASSDVTVKSNAAAPNIGILDPLTWASSHRLALDSHESINVRAPIVIEGTSGITLITNDGGTGGDYNFNTATSGSITFWDTASSLIINGKSFTLVKDISALASEIATDPSGDYALAALYDASVQTYKTSPIPTPFAGIFEGLGNPISNFTIGGSLRRGRLLIAGLFASTSGTLRDVTLTNVSISTAKSRSSGPAGALAVYNSGSIVNAAVSGTISNSGNEAGGLVDSNAGTIVRSSTNVSVIADHAGGLVRDNGGTISWSSAAGSVTGVDEAGGLADSNVGTISDSSAQADVGATRAGGLVENNKSTVNNKGTILRCHASGLASGAVFAGGLVAINGSDIVQSFATGAAIASSDSGSTAGGLVGFNSGGIMQSYATGEVQSDSSSHNRAGGLIGLNARRGRVSESFSSGPVTSPFRGGFLGLDRWIDGQQFDYWNLDTSKVSNPHQGAGQPLDDPGITGLTDAQLKSALPAGFDPNVWGQSASINNGWPYLLANPPPQ